MLLLVHLCHSLFITVHRPCPMAEQMSQPGDQTYPFELNQVQSSVRLCFDSVTASFCFSHLL